MKTKKFEFQARVVAPPRPASHVTRHTSHGASYVTLPRAGSCQAAAEVTGCSQASVGIHYLSSLYLYLLTGLVSVSDKELQTRNTICILYLGSGQCQDGDGSQVPASPSPLSTPSPGPGLVMIANQFNNG